jgi:hypothetical protein
VPEPNNVNLGDTVFLMPCRAGNTTLKLMVWLSRFGVPIDNMAKERKLDYHIHSTQGRFDYIALKDIDRSKQLVVGLMREPYARALSMWGFSGVKVSFEIWLRDLGKDLGSNQHVRTQAAEFMLDGKLLPHVMIYLEHIEEDFAALCRLKRWTYVPPPAYRNTLEESKFTRRDPMVGNVARAREHLFSHYAVDFVLYRLLWDRRVANVTYDGLPLGWGVSWGR